MRNILFSLLFVYIFILLGYMAKAIFKEEIEKKTLTLLSVYFLQPFVTMWGFSTAKLDTSHIAVPLLYLGIVLLLFIPTLLLGKILFTDLKQRAIFSIAGFVGNTGNIGIPLGIALFGEESVIYTTLINIANVFVVYSLGVYLYSRGSFSIKESLVNMLKIPILPISLIAIFINIYDIPIHHQIEHFLKMGAYAGMVMQLILLGTFLETIEIKTINKKLFFGVIGQKFIFLPLATALILTLTTLPIEIKMILMMEMIVPLAVANINLASLYNCKPNAVTTLIFFTTLIFIPILFTLEYLKELFF